MKKIIAALAAIVGLTTTAAVEWNTNFQKSLAYAEANSIPIVVVWGNTSCSHCNELHEALDESAELEEWQSEHEVILVMKHEKYGSQKADYLAAKEWIKSINPKLSSLPFVGVYWKKADGTVISEAFTGRDGTMYATTPRGDLAGQFVNSLDQLVGEYPPAPTGESSFVAKDTENDRLEAEKDTEVVFVPVKRETGDVEKQNVLKAKYPSGAMQTVPFTWPAGVTEMTVRLELLQSEFDEGSQIKLTLTDTDGITLAKSSIAMVEDMENLPKNPHWVGEYTAKTLPYGEWTMDFDVAKEKVKTYGGKLVAMFGGPLWCPNCVVIEDDVFSTKEFKNWAKKEKIVLVHFDQGQASSPSTPAGTSRGRLLTLTPSESSTNKGGTGASYMSRHGIEPGSAEAQAVMDRVTKLTEEWLAPESTAARLANPVVLLLNDEGTKVDARFQRQGDSKEMDLDENMCRLKDLVTLGGDNEKKGYVSTTPLTLENESDSVEYHINSRKIFYRLTGLEEGEYVAASVLSADPDAQDVYASLVTASGTEIAAGRGYVALKDPLTALQAEELYLMTTAYDTPQSTFFGKATSFEATVSVKSSEEEPEQKVAFSPNSSAKAMQQALNQALYQKQSATVPIYEATNLGGKRLVGTLAVSVTAANKITAKFAGEKTVSFSGTWDEISLSSGLVTTTLAKSVSRVPYTLDLAMDAKGGFEAAVFADGERIGSGVSAAGDVASYAGNYTVTLVDSEGEAGTGNLTIKITTAGKATVKGIMPDGTSISISAVVSPNLDGTATLPIYKASSKYAVSMALAIKPDADETWGSEGDKYTVGSVTGCLATWTTDDETKFEVYGGYWESTTPLAICEQYKLSEVLDVVIGGETNDVVKATRSGFTVTKTVLTSLSFTKSTGAFSGKAKVYVDALRKTVTATVKGVLLPGWIDCKCGGEPVVERPYGSGTVYYKSGRTTVSLPIDLVAEASE